MTDEGVRPPLLQFSRVLPGDWYDGPIWGIAVGDDGTSWSFTLLAVDEQTLDWRLYCAGRVEPALLLHIEEMHALLWPPGGGQDPPEVEARFRELWSRADPAELVILTDNLGGPRDRMRTLATSGLRQACAELLGGTHLTDQHQEPDQFGSRILERARFLGACEPFFGPVDLPDLDAEE